MTQQRTATHMQATRMQGFIRAVADQTHPLQTKLSLILTDFEPNRNKQGVPLAEAENILRTAKSSPIKINFDGEAYAGHTGAIPIGPIVDVYYSDDNGRQVIAGDAVIWNDIYEDIADHLKVAFAEGVGTSWEIYYDKDSSTVDANGIEWLSGCVFAGTCVVDTPAYGPNRTRLLAIAEELSKHANELVEKTNMAKTDTTGTTNVVDNTVAIPVTNSVNSNTVANAATEDATTLRTDISSLLDTLSNMYSGLYEMLDQTYELEASLVTTDMSGMAEQFTKLVASVAKRFSALKDQASKAESAEAELKTLKDGIAQAESERAEKEKLEVRRVSLAEVGIEITEEKQAFYLEMADDTFTQYVEDLKLVKGNKVVAEVRKPVIPEPTNNGAQTTISIKELAALITGNR